LYFLQKKAPRNLDEREEDKKTDRRKVKKEQKRGSRNENMSIKDGDSFIDGDHGIRRRREEHDGTSSAAVVVQRMDCVEALYGDSAFPKRRKTAPRSGRWFVVMFARNRETETSVCKTERTRISYTAHIGSVLVTDAEERRPSQQHRPKTVACPRRPRSQWKVVLAIGPMRDEQNADAACRLWSLGQKGVLNKAARGEALSVVFDVPGFVDWSMVFGGRGLAGGPYTAVFYRNPCRNENEEPRQKNQ
jgi:hypothetical protein